MPRCAHCDYTYPADDMRFGLCITGPDGDPSCVVRAESGQIPWPATRPATEQETDAWHWDTPGAPEYAVMTEDGLRVPVEPEDSDA